MFYYIISTKERIENRKKKMLDQEAMFNLAFSFLYYLPDASRHETPALNLSDEFIPIKICQKLLSIDQKLEFLLCDNPMALKSKLGLTAQ